MRRVDMLLERLREPDRSSAVVFTHAYFIKALRLRLAHASAAINDSLMAAFRDTWRFHPVENAGSFTIQGGTLDHLCIDGG
jgi:hypothetical protein